MNGFDDMAAVSGPRGTAIAAEESSNRLEQCVPSDAVSVAEEGQDSLVAPEVGDTVRYEVAGKVTRVDGGHVYVEPETINGQDVTEESPESGVQSPEAELEQAARDIDAQAGY